MRNILPLSDDLVSTPAAIRIRAIGELATGCALRTVGPSGTDRVALGPAGWTVGRVLGGRLLALEVAGLFAASRSPEPGVALGFVSTTR
jgi:hypothetical protein